VPNKLRHDYKPNTASAGDKRNPATSKISLPKILARFWAAQSRIVQCILSLSLLCIIAILAWPQNKNTSTPLSLIGEGNEINLILDLPQLETSSQNTIESTETVNLQPNEQEIVITVKSGDTLGEIFTKNKLSYADMLAILKNKEAKNHLINIKPKEKLRLISTNNEGHIQSLKYEIDVENTLVVERNKENELISRVENTPLDIRTAYSHGVIKDSLFLAGKEAGLSDSLVMNLAGIFQWDIDFVSNIRKNDSFTVIYEQLWRNGEYLKNGKVLAAEFINDGDVFHAIRFVDENDDGNYYSPNGKSMKKAFLRAPIAFSPRVTSSFNPKRFHPVHKKVRPHRGVDYGGPLNTPILAAGDGKVIFRGRKGGYGRTVILQHGGNITTLYAHLNKFNSKVKHGSRVKQGQTIGYLGASGTVTAKHLHYEYRLNGTHRNPRTVKLPNANPLPKKYKNDFEKIKKPLLAQLDVIKRANVVTAKKAPSNSSQSASAATQ